MRVALLVIWSVVLQEVASLQQAMSPVIRMWVVLQVKFPMVTLGTAAGTITYGNGTSGTVALSGSGSNNNLGGIVGGIVNGGTLGGIGSTTTVSNNVTYTTSAGSTNIGGIVGIVSGSSGATTMEGTFNNIALAVLGTNVGGYIGQYDNSSSTTAPLGSLSNTQSVSTTHAGVTNVGGIIGLMAAGTINGTLSNSGTISGASNVGGDIGFITGGTFATTAVLNTTQVLAHSISGTADVGGLIGKLGSVSALNINYGVGPIATFTNAENVSTSSRIQTIGGISVLLRMVQPLQQI